MRALPAAANRPMAEGRGYFVDGNKGDDQHPGTLERPWKTLQYAISKLQPGDTLYLRGGTYYEKLRCKLAGTAERPITLRSYPGELAIIDGGYREFFETPAEAWEPVPEGGEHEYRSIRTYPTGGGFGNFGDSMIPFHRYITFEDLRSNNELYHTGLSDRAHDPTGMYCGPGVRRDPETGRIHIRLAHTRLAGLGANHYRGETDPRKLPLVIAGQDHALEIEKASHLRVQDLVIRGAQRAAVRIADSEHIELDGITAYGSLMALRISGTNGLRLRHSALRGHAAPWHSRFHHKNRAGSGYLVLTEGSNSRFEIAHCELTDHHDCIQLHSVDDVRLHHSLIDNFNDDGIEPGPKKERGQMFIYQNRISRCLSPFTAHGKKPNLIASQEGSGVYIYRNLVDLRQGTYKTPPSMPDPSGKFLNEPTTILAHDHGSPTWPVAYIYHNTFLMGADAWRDYYAFTWGSHMRGTTRRVFNNIFLQVEGLPGLNFMAVSADDDFQSDGNLFWGLTEGPSQEGDFFAAFRSSPVFAASRRQYPPGWGAHDRFADPKFVALSTSVESPLDVRLRPDSPAIDAGIKLPEAWPDPLREIDQGAADIGALPLNAPPLSDTTH